MRQLAPEARLERGEQVELAAVVAAVVRTTERDDAVRVIAAPEQPQHQVRGIRRPRAAYHAAELPHLLTLRAGGRTDRRGAQRRPAP